MPPLEPRSPRTPQEFARYFDLRWQVLRAPWNEPRGSECDDFDLPGADAVHAALFDEQGDAIAVGRLHFNSLEEAKIRYMAVRPSERGQGLGRRIVAYLESHARRRNAKRIILNARDSAAPFYEVLGYRHVGEGPLMFGAIRHLRMEKTLGNS